VQVGVKDVQVDVMALAAEQAPTLPADTSAAEAQVLTAMPEARAVAAEEAPSEATAVQQVRSSGQTCHACMQKQLHALQDAAKARRSASSAGCPTTVLCKGRTLLSQDAWPFSLLPKLYHYCA
jgi:hypothetical protein